jgi:uncharacterized membrane-anchored protein
MSTRVLPEDHPQRYPMTLELHARPFPPVAVPSQAIQLAFKPMDDRARDPAAHLDHLIDLIDRFGGPRPARDAAHYFAELGRIRLKWERHTEFVSYTFYEDGPAETPFELPVESVAPEDWLAAAPGALLSAIRIHVEAVADRDAAEEAVRGRLMRHFVRESYVAAHVGEGQATVIGDFRIHEDGFSRFAVLADPNSGSRRLGRVVQRLIEVDTYRMLSMLALPVAREMSDRLNGIERELTGLIGAFSAESRGDPEMLADLVRVSAEIEAQAAETAFRFAASKAYAALVEQRIDILREARAADRQLLSEFMARRFKPAMRTCAAAEARLHDLADRANRTTALLSARVNVAVETQNQALLESMNRRAETQLRLQRTVEGLSVVAISYYAVSLAAYLVAPFAGAIGLDKPALTALIAVPVILGVWAFIRRVRREIEGEG